MIDPKIWIPVVVSIILILVAVHLIVALVLPRLKTAFLGLTKDDKVANALVTILFFVVTVYAISALIPLVAGLEGEVFKYITALQPSVDVLVNFLPALQWTVVGTVVALGLR